MTRDSGATPEASSVGNGPPHGQDGETEARVVAVARSLEDLLAQWKRREPFAGFRATSLVYVEDPELLRALHRFGAFLNDVFQGVQQERAPKEWAIPGVARELGAVAMDLHHLVAFLGLISAEPELTEVTEVERRLAIVAGEVAPEIERIARRLEAAGARLDGEESGNGTEGDA